jgi:cytochrome c oxidase cbb3-type subunit 3
MLSFIKHHFDSIEGIGIYSVIATLIFFIIFVSMIVMVFLMKKKFVEEGSHLPLEDDDNYLNQ